VAAVNIYEVVNRARRESLIALCADDSGGFRLRLRARPPDVAHWGPEETLEIEQIAEAMPVADAEEFLAQFLELVRSDAWRTYAWRC
jgi:hypothetical protein